MTAERAALTSAVGGVSVLAEGLLVAAVGPDGRARVRVLVDQILNTFPAAEAKDRAQRKSLCFPSFPTQTVSADFLRETESAPFICFSGSLNSTDDAAELQSDRPDGVEHLCSLRRTSPPPSKRISSFEACQTALCKHSDTNCKGGVVCA